MRKIGFSTGALACGDFERALEMMRGHNLPVVELSALREHELRPLATAAPALDLGGYQYVAVHAPSRIDPAREAQVVAILRGLSARGWPVVVHPDAVHDWSRWRALGAALLVENMDRRKPCGRSVDELEQIFERAPEAGLCFDVGHARQCDTSMTEAYLILRRFADRLKQVHLSEVTSQSRHDRLSRSAIRATREVAALIPEEIPIVLESPVTREEMREEVARAEEALTAAKSRSSGAADDLVVVVPGPA